MKSKKTIVSLALIIAVLVLGIGYAALSQTLTVNGTANIKDDFVVEFDPDNITLGENVASATVSEGNVEANVTVNLVRDSEETATQTFTIQNLSKELYAQLDANSDFVITYDGDAADYITVTAGLETDGVKLDPVDGANNTVDLELTVTLNDDAPAIAANDGVNKGFTITFDAEAKES